jgi:hypothetical protein
LHDSFETEFPLGSFLHDSFETEFWLGALLQGCSGMNSGWATFFPTALALNFRWAGPSLTALERNFGWAGSCTTAFECYSDGQSGVRREHAAWPQYAEKCGRCNYAAEIRGFSERAWKLPDRKGLEYACRSSGTAGATCCHSQLHCSCLPALQIKI